ncbi:glycosyltransferase family 4 protein [Candidatus Omnitrophota bacterium]
MKICRILCGYSPYALGGADMRAEKISRKLEERNNQATIITIKPTRGNVTEKDGDSKIYRFHPFNISTIHHIGKKSIIKQGIWTLLDIYSLYSFKKIRDILKKENPDLVHLHTPVDVTLSAINAVKQLRLPLVYTLHDYFLLCRRFVLLHGFKKLCTEKNINPLCRTYREFTKKVTRYNIDVVIAPSQFVLDMHTRCGFFENSKKIVLPHGLEVENVNENKKNITHKEKGEFNIFYIGTLRSHKGVDVLIHAFKKINWPNLKLHIVGDGADRSNLERLAKDDKRIIFHGKFSHQNTQEFYKKADILIVPSIWYDVRPNVIPEAFRAGVPVIGSDIGGIPESIKNKFNGYLFEAGNIEQLYEILDNIIKNPTILQELSKNAYESVKELEMESYITKLTKIYEEAIEINKLRNLKH